MKLSVGIVGLPNAGKSTLFNALLKKQQALAANYPFATIEPNVGVVSVEDERLYKLARIVDTDTVIPSIVEFYDIAGLVAGAHKGEGLGNKFLAHIREVSLIVHVLRYFEDEDVIKTGANPVADFETVKTELILKDLETLEKQMEPKGVVSKQSKERWKVIQKLKDGLEAGSQVIEMFLGKNDRELVEDLFLLTAKPALWVLNIGEKDVKKIGLIERQFVNWGAMAICAKMEAELAAFSLEEREEYLKVNDMRTSGLDRLARKAFDKLGLISFMTAGQKEVRSWTIQKGTKASQAAGVIHSDFEDNFIKVQACSYDDFIKVGGWQKAREQGLVRIEGKDYVVKDNDVLEFVVGR